MVENTTKDYKFTDTFICANKQFLGYEYDKFVCGEPVEYKYRISSNGGWNSYSYNVTTEDNREFHIGYSSIEDWELKNTYVENIDNQVAPNLIGYIFSKIIDSFK